MIYLDYAANTPADELVLECYLNVERNFQGNPNTSHPAGALAREELEKITTSIGKILNISDNEIIYTSGASESNNLAIKGIARAQRHTGKHIISTPLEHPSISGCLNVLQQQGYEVDLVRIKQNGEIDIDNLFKLLRKDTILVCVSSVDSELGTIQPITEIINIIKNFPNCLLHVDATQAIGKIRFSFDEIDTVSISPHKFFGLNGSGILLKRKYLFIEPLINGEKSTTVYRSGTPTLALNSALESALSLTYNYFDERKLVVESHHNTLISTLSKYPKVRINSPENSVPHIINLSVQNVKGTEFQKVLGRMGICVSVKSACSTEGTPSRAVFAVSNDRKNALSSWRISISHLTTQREINEFLNVFDHCYKEFTK